MKFRDIAKMHAANRGLKNDMTEGDMRHYLDHLGDDDSVTPGRLEKANNALADLRESMFKKWGFEKKFAKAPVPATETENTDGE